MEQKIIVLREYPQGARRSRKEAEPPTAALHTQRTRHRSWKDVRARQKICGVLAALCFLLLLGAAGGMENGTMALGAGVICVAASGAACVLLTWAAGGFRYAEET